MNVIADHDDWQLGELHKLELGARAFLIAGCLFARVIAGPDPAPHRPPVDALPARPD